MEIVIKRKIRPFSHESGLSCLLPKSSWQARIYPAHIQLSNLLNGTSFSITPDICGPLEKFTIMQDLEKNWIRVFGQSPNGFFSYRLFVYKQELILFLERCPKEGISFLYEGNSHLLFKKDELICPITNSFNPLDRKERIDFGCAKKQDWQLVKRRLKLEEILPVWFHLGQNVEETSVKKGPLSDLLIECQALVKEKKSTLIGPKLLEIFKAGFDGILSPRIHNTDHMGPLKDPSLKESSPLFLLSQGAHLIRALFIQEEKNSFSILPCNLPSLHAGRLKGIHLSSTLICDLEWSKKTIRRMSLQVLKDQVQTFKFPSNIQSFRVRHGKKNKGKIHLTNTSLFLKKDRCYYFDLFLK